MDMSEKLRGPKDAASKKKQALTPLLWLLKVPSQPEDPSSPGKQQAKGGICLVFRPLCFQHPPHPPKQKDRELWDRNGDVSSV